MRARNRKLSQRQRNRLEEYQQRLLARRDQLRQTLAGQLQNLASAQGEVLGELADAALDFGTQEMSYRTVEIAGRELVLVERALQKIAQGRYGRCENCGRQIPAARLRALPHAQYCIACHACWKAAAPATTGSTLDGNAFSRWNRPKTNPMWT